MEYLISDNDFERVIAPLFSRVQSERNPFEDSEFDDISRLLRLVGKEQWSIRPRTYAVLRLIDQTDMLDTFVSDGRKDIAFPYEQFQLPNSFSPEEKAKFLEAQRLVLSKTADLEKPNGPHSHLAQEPDAHFQHLRFLGQGAFGLVDLVRSKFSYKEYARKRMLKRTFTKSQVAVKLFENELATVKKLKHRHLIQIVGSYTDPKYVGFLMLPVAQCDLKVFLEREPFPEAEYLTLRGFFGCLNSALLFLHNSNLKHKDLKPANILVSANEVLITDFGTARDWSGQLNSTTGGKSGPFTHSYAAPEVVVEDQRGSSADIWSLGCVYLDLITILRGESLASRNIFFKDKGTCSTNIYSNLEVVDLWLYHMKPGADIRPFKWIKQMIVLNRKKRITAAALMEQIHSYEEGHLYYNPCCREEDIGPNKISNVFEETPTALEESQDRIGLTTDSSNIEENPNDEDTQLVISHGFNIHDSSDMELGLRSAAEEGDEALVRALLAKGVDVLAKSPEGSTALHKAVENGYVAVVKLLLLEKTTDIESKSSAGLTPLQIASKNADETLVRLLLENGADVLAKTQEKNTALHIAAQYGHATVMCLLLENGADVAAPNLDGHTVLHIAIQCGHKGMVELLMTMIGEKGLDIDAKNNAGLTPLYIAVSTDQEAIILLLLENSANIAAKDRSEISLLQVAAAKGNTAIVQLLLKNRADVRLRDPEGITPLHNASSAGHKSVVQLLLEHGAIVDTQSKKGSTALHCASSGGHKSVVELLLGSGAIVDSKSKKGSTALHYASSGGHESVVELLLGNGATVDTQSKRGSTALHCASSGGHKSVVELLLGSGAIVDTQSKKGSTALHCASSGGHKSVVELLLGSGAIVDSKSKKGSTALHNASAEGHDSVVQLLLRNGATVDTKSKRGSTALHYASSGGHDSVVQLLLEHGAIVDTQSKKGSTALHYASSGGHESVVELLLRSGANVDTQSKKGSTALHYASSRGHESVVELLLRSGANVDTKSKKGFTALHYASANGDSSVVHLLLEKNPNIDEKDMSAQTALDKAAYKRHVDVVQLLLLGAISELMPTNERQNSALQRAVVQGHKKSVSLLAPSGADINAKNSEGLTPLHIAVNARRLDIVKVLLHAGADINAKVDDLHGNTPLHIAALGEYKEIAELLIKRGANYLAKNKVDDTPLHIAINLSTSSDWSMIDLLLYWAANDPANNIKVNSPYIISAPDKRLRVRLARGMFHIMPNN